MRHTQHLYIRTRHSHTAEKTFVSIVYVETQSVECVWLLSNMYSYVNHWTRFTRAEKIQKQKKMRTEHCEYIYKSQTSRAETVTSSHYVVTFARDKYTAHSRTYFSGRFILSGKCFPSNQKKTKSCDHLQPEMIQKSTDNTNRISEILNLFVKLKFACFNTEIQFVR